MDDKFKQIKAEKEQLDKKFKELQADMPADDPKWNNMYDCMNNMARNIYASIDYLHQRINTANDNHTKHLSRHIPPMTPSQMEKHLKNIGASDDFTVEKPTISMAKINNQFVLEASYQKKN